MMLHDIVKKGSTNRSVTVRIVDSTDGTPENGVVWNTAGIDMWYRREGAAKVSITEATLAALTTAHADGGFLFIGDGYYRLDLEDAAFATGAQHVDFGGTVTGMVVIGGRVRLVDYDPENAVTLGLSAWYAGKPKKNTAFTGTIPFPMQLTNGDAATGKSPTAVRSIDEAAEAAVDAGTTIVETGGGGYAFSAIAAVDLNGDTILFRVSATGCKDTLLVVNTVT